MTNKDNLSKNHSDNDGRAAAVDLIKQRIRKLYGAETEKPERNKSELVDRFWQQHKDHPNPQSAWQTFYGGLTDVEKHSLWNEYRSTSPSNSLASQQITPTPAIKEKLEPEIQSATFNDLSSKDRSKKNIPHSSHKKDSHNIKRRLIKKVKLSSKEQRRNAKKAVKKSGHHWRPLIISLSAMLLWAFAQYNPLIFAFAKQYISPGDTLRSPVIVDPSADINIGKESKIIIPKINVDIPVIYDLGTRDERTIQKALERGVVQYHGTSVPGQAGNTVIVGHSSNNFLNSGKYKFAFVLLDRLKLDDTFILNYKGTRYVYKVTNKQVVEPTDFSLTLPTKTPTTSLIACTPPGTSWRRLVVQGVQISPTISNAQKDPSNIPKPIVDNAQGAIVPSNAPSFFQKIKDWIF